MKIEFTLPADNKYHQYCLNCHSEHIHRIFIGEKTFYKCDHCNNTHPRLVVIDPHISWWIDPQTKEYWHESVGIFLHNEDNEILFFERTIFPFAFTIPSGHVDTGETPTESIVREIYEEIGASLRGVKLFSTEDVVGDECRRGADNHKWHVFTAKISKSTSIILNDEGVKPMWLSIRQAVNKELVYPVKYFILKYGHKLIA